MSGSARRYFSNGRRPSEAASRVQKCSLVFLLVLDRQEASQTRAPSGGRTIPGTMWTPSSASE